MPEVLSGAATICELGVPAHLLRPESVIVIINVLFAGVVSAEDGAGIGYLLISYNHSSEVLVKPFEMVVVEFYLDQHFAESIDRRQALLGQVPSDLICQISLTALVESVGKLTQQSHKIVNSLVTFTSLQISEELLKR